jgi:hypothetical protein
MKVYVEHDDEGNIKSIGIPNISGTKSAGLKPRHGRVVSEVDAPDGRHEGDIEHLKELRRRFRIAGGRLVPR